jgi:hypothetical protein
MNAAQLRNNLTKLCKLCKQKFFVNIADLWQPDFRKVVDVCKNCCTYLLNCYSSNNNGVTLVNTLTCRSCLPMNVRYDCKYVNAICSCEFDGKCLCCRVCRNTLSYKTNDIVSHGDRCYICNHHLIHIYNDTIFDRSSRDLHTRVLFK